MTDRTTYFVFVGFWKRVLAALIDAAVGWAIMPITIRLMFWSIAHRNILPQILWSIVWTVLWLWLVVRFGGTPGKLIIRARIVDARGQFLSWGRAILRILPSLAVSLNSFLQIGAAISKYPESTPHATFLEIGRLMNEYGQPFSTLAMMFGFFIYIDIGVILFNRQKRAVHDFIAGSYVISKTSYDEVRAEYSAALDGELAGAPSPPVSYAVRTKSNY